MRDRAAYPYSRPGMPSNAILHFGHDQSLLHSRGAVLAKSQARVDSVSSFLQLEECLRARCYRLFVLCHTLSAKERERAIALVWLRVPNIHVLALQARKSVVFPGAQILSTDTGPQALRFAVQSLLDAADESAKSFRVRADPPSLSRSDRSWNPAPEYLSYFELIAENEISVIRLLFPLSGSRP